MSIGRKIEKILFGSVVLVVIVGYLPFQVWCQVPEQINFQARINGLVQFEPFNLQLSIFDESVGGNLMWQQAYPNMDHDRGLITLQLEGGQPNLSTLFGSTGPLFVEIEVNGETLLPRFPFSSVPYSFRASIADSVADGSITSLQLAESVVTTEKIADGAVTLDKLAPQIQLIPFALGIVQQNALVTGSPTIARVSYDELAGYYIVELQDANYELSSYVTLITLIDGSDLSASISEDLGNLIVRITNNGEPSQGEFHFVIYKL